MARSTLIDSNIPSLRSLILGNAATLTWRNEGNDGAIQDWLNADDPTPTKAWNTSADPRVIDESTPWINFDNIVQQGKRDSYLHAFFRYPRDFSTNAVRKWITDVWGTAADAQAILAAALVNASRAQAVIGGTVKTTATISGLDRTFIGQVTNDWMIKIRGAGW